MDNIFGLGGSVVLSSPSQDLEGGEESEYESEYEEYEEEEVIEEEEEEEEGEKEESGTSTLMVDTTISTQDGEPKPTADDSCKTPQASNVTGIPKDSTEEDSKVVARARASSSATIVSLPPSNSETSFSSSGTGTVAKIPEPATQSQQASKENNETVEHDVSSQVPPTVSQNLPPPLVFK